MNSYSKACTLMFFCTLMMMTLLVADGYSAVTYVGVSKGDYAVYSVIVGLKNSTNAPKSLVDYYKNMNNTKWKLKVEEVSNMEVTVSINKTLKNGTKIETYTGNLTNGSGKNLSMWVILNNLHVGDKIYQGTETNIRISNITSVEFAGAKRDVMYAYFNGSQSNVYSGYNAFWDKETGILCGMISVDKSPSYENPSLIVQTNLLIIETNLWNKTNSNSDETIKVTALVLVSVFLSTLASWIIIRKRRKTRRHSRTLH